MEFCTSGLLLHSLEQSQLNLYCSFKSIQTILHLMYYTHFNKAFFTFNMS